MTKIIGFALFGLSFLVWGLIFIVPWFDFTKGQIAGITTALIILGEVSFYASVVILGKAFIDKIKSALFFWKKKTPENVDTSVDIVQEDTDKRQAKD
jgi:hypothetical protein